MSTKKFEEALRLLVNVHSALGAPNEYAATVRLVADAKAEVHAIRQAAASHVQNRRLWRKIAEES